MMLKYLMFFLFSFAMPAFAGNAGDCSQSTNVLFAAYFGVWVITLILVLRIAIKAANTAKEIQRMEAELKEVEGRLTKNIKK